MIRVLIVDEIPLMGSLLASVIGEAEDMEVVAIARTVAEAAEKLDEATVLLVSTTFDEMESVMLTRQAVKSDEDLCVLVIGISSDPARILDHIEAGACGYVLREDTTESLLESIRTAVEGGAIISKDMASRLMGRLAKLAEECLEEMPELPPEVTPREREVLNLLAEGLTNKAISTRLFIEVGTVKNHVHSILRKLNVRTRQEAAAYLAAVGRGED